jgi:hypothetical protein
MADRYNAPPTDNLKVAKSMLERPIEDLGDFELAEITARATVALADAMDRLAEAFTKGNAGVFVAEA